MLSQVIAVAAQSGYITSNDGYVTGTVPQALSLTVSFSNGVAAPGDTITVSFNTNIFTGSAPAVSADVGLWSTWQATANSITGKYAGTGALSGSMTVEISGTGVFDNLPAPGDVQVTASSTDNGGGTGGDTGTPGSIFQIVPAPTITLSSADMYEGTAPTGLMISLTSPETMEAGQTVLFTSSAGVLKAGMTTGATESGTVLTSYMTISSTTFMAVIAQRIDAGDVFSIAFDATLLEELPTSPGNVTFDFDMGAPITRKIASDTEGFGTILVFDPTSGFVGTLTSANGFVEGTTAPEGLFLTANFPQGVATAGDTVTFILNKNFFTGGAATVSTSVGSWSSWVTNFKTITGTYAGTGLLQGPISIDITGTGVFDTLPSAGPLTLTATAADNGGGTGGDAAGTPVAIFYVIAPPTFYLDTWHYTPGGQPMYLELSYVIPEFMNNGFTLEISADRDWINSLQNTGVTITGFTVASYASITNQLFRVSLGAAVNGGATAYFKFEEPMIRFLPSPPGDILFDIQTISPGPTVRQIVKDIVGITVMPTTTTPPGAVGGDPVTWFGNLRAEFDLPLHQLTTLLRTPDMEVAAAPFAGWNGDQWIGRLAIKSASGKPVLQIDARKDLRDFDRSLLLDGDFDTMDFGVGDPGQCAFDTNKFVHPSGIHAAWNRAADCTFERFRACTEVVVIVGQYAKLLIESAPAREMYGGVDAHAHVHLDFQVFDMTSKETFEGPLAEMWGLKPEISDSTRKLLKGDIIRVFDIGSENSTNVSVAKVQSKEPAILDGACSEL